MKGRLCLFAICCSAFVLPTNALGAMQFFPDTGHYYEAVLVGSSGITWDDASTAAQVAGGYLATITSAEENAFVFNLINDPQYYTAVSVNGDYLGPWLGGFHDSGDPFEWVTGEAFSYTNWEPGQPDGFAGSTQKVQFYKKTSASVGSTWGDHPGGPIPGFDLPTAYVVEYVPEPSSLILGLFAVAGLAAAAVGKRRIRPA